MGGGRGSGGKKERALSLSRPKTLGESECVRLRHARARGLGVRAREEVGKFRQALLGVPSPQQQQQELVPVRGREEAEQLN